MARRSGATHKGVEEKRRSLPIYEHYTLSPGKTKSHHPEAKCNHCHKEFVCGSKQRLIRHLRKCNNISNPEQIIAETLNTLARNSATGQLNHSILEASNLLPSQIQQHSQHHHHHHHHHQQIIGQLTHSPNSATTTITTANSNINNNNNNNIISNHNTSGSSNNDGSILGTSSNNPSSQQLQQQQLINAMSIPIKRPQKRGRKPANQSLASSSPTIHVTTGLDGKTRFTPASQLPPNATATVTSPLITGPVYTIGAAGVTGYPAYSNTNVVSTAIVGSNPINSVNHHSIPGHLTPTNHHSTPTYKFNSDPADKAYLKLVLTRNLPLSLCDTKEFQMWVKTFANDYKPPNSINLIAQNLKNEAQAAKQRISNILVKAFKKTINLELHSWPDSDNHQLNNGHQWFAIIANIDHKRFLVSLKDIKENQNNVNPNQQQSTNDQINQSNIGGVGKMLSNFIDECIKKTGSDRINSLVFSGDDCQHKAKVSQILYTTHPSIITYQCWWHFTNLLCSDIIEQSLLFQDVIRKSNRLIHFVTKKPNLSLNLEKFNPFVGFVSNVIARKNDQRWYSHLVCYLLEYIKNNEAIIRALQIDPQPPQTNQSQEPSDNNNNSSGTQQNSSTQSQVQVHSYNDDSLLISMKSLVTSEDYWNNLNSSLRYLKPIHDILALSGTLVSNNSTNTQQASLVVASNLYLSQYMGWFLNYGKILIQSWRQNADPYKYQLIAQFLNRFAASQQNFKLLLAAYLLDPKHRCAYMTQHAKNIAIEEILNIASEFMPEESDGHTIFDQWKLYLVRDEPYDVVYDETRSNPLEWWMSLPCAESIRRVALRILRLKAFASPKPETLFSQLYIYEKETNANLNNSTYENLAILRYFYDFEDKVGQPVINSSNFHNLSTSNSSNNSSLNNTNSYHDRTHVGQQHNYHHHEINNTLNYLPDEQIILNDNHEKVNGSNNTSASDSNCGRQLNDSTTSISSAIINSKNGRAFTSDSGTFGDLVVESYLGENGQPINHYHNLSNSQISSLEETAQKNHSIEDLSEYKLFAQYVDYNIMGVRLAEEPIEKKKRKWTAQEILSKCQSNHQNNNII